MTLYSYWKAKKEGEEYVEPVMINKLISNADGLPEIRDKNSHPAGWALHYLTGIGFVAAYWLLWRRALNNPSAAKLFAIGSLSGLVGISAWKYFSQRTTTLRIIIARAITGSFLQHISFSRSWQYWPTGWLIQPNTNCRVKKSIHIL